MPGARTRGNVKKPRTGGDGLSPASREQRRRSPARPRTARPSCALAQRGSPAHQGEVLGGVAVEVERAPDGLDAPVDRHGEVALGAGPAAAQVAGDLRRHDARRAPHVRRRAGLARTTARTACPRDAPRRRCRPISSRCGPMPVNSEARSPEPNWRRRRRTTAAPARLPAPAGDVDHRGEVARRERDAGRRAVAARRRPSARRRGSRARSRARPRSSGVTSSVRA